MIDALPRCTPRSSGRFKVFATRDYYVQLTKEVHATKTGDRVALATMAFLPENPLCKALLEALVAAAKRGVHTSLQLDSYVFMIGSQRVPGPLFWKIQPLSDERKMAPLFRKKWHILQQLREAGVVVTITNSPTKRYTSPFSGRSHVKYSIINNTVYLGGCNLGQPHFDCMVRWEDAATATWLYELNQLRQGQPQTRQAWGEADFVRRVDAQTSILVDVGVKNQSIIYQEALAAIDRATKWIVLTCQYFPHSVTGEHLLQAHRRGVAVYLIFNHYSSHKTPHTLLQRSVTSRERRRLPSSFFTYEQPPRARYLHAKILATDQELLLGSHNYVPAGVRFGTAEIALHNQGDALAKASAELILEELGLHTKSDFAFLR